MWFCSPRVHWNHFTSTLCVVCDIIDSLFITSLRSIEEWQQQQRGSEGGRENLLKTFLSFDKIIKMAINCSTCTFEAYFSTIWRSLVVVCGYVTHPFEAHQLELSAGLCVKYILLSYIFYDVLFFPSSSSLEPAYSSDSFQFFSVFVLRKRLCIFNSHIFYGVSSDCSFSLATKRALHS